MADEADWSQIPPDLLVSITKFLKIYGDYVILRAVCVNWRSWLPPTPPHHLPCQLPWLLLPPSPPTTNSQKRRRFYDLLNGKIHTLNLPEASHPRRICGSSNGWLIIVGETPEIFCHNPLTKAKVFLPPLSTLPSVVSFNFSDVGREYSIRDSISGQNYTLDLRQMRDYFIRKVIFIPSSVNGSLSIAIAIVSCNLTATSELVVCKNGDTCWKLVQIPDFYPEDVVYCESEGLFYAVNEIGNIAVFDLASNPVIIPTETAIEGDLRYLVKSGGILFLVSRFLGAEADLVAYCEVYETIGIEVYEFRESFSRVGWASWVKVTDMGGRILFVGGNSSLALPASDYRGCKENSVYFTDDHSKSNDVGVFDLTHDCIEPLPCYPQETSFHLHCSSPIWITPNPW